VLYSRALLLSTTSIKKFGYTLMAEKMFMQALGMGIAEEMRIDPKVFLMGEDVRASVYGAAKGLYDEFGDDRVLNTPLSENGFLVQQ